MKRNGSRGQNYHNPNNTIRNLLGVHPSQYERILKRREERYRTMERRGRPVPVYFPIMPLGVPTNHLPYLVNSMKHEDNMNGNNVNARNNQAATNNHAGNRYANCPRNAHMSAAYMNATNYAQANYYNQMNQNAMYNPYYGYRDANGYPVMPNESMPPPRINPYRNGQNAVEEQRPRTPRASNTTRNIVEIREESSEASETEPPSQRDTVERRYQVSTEHQEEVNRQYYRVVERRPDEVNMAMESNTTEELESGSEPSPSGTNQAMRPPMTPEAMARYMAANGPGMFDQNMAPNTAENMYPNMLANAHEAMVPYGQVNGTGATGAYVNPNMPPPSMVPKMMPPNRSPPNMPPPNMAPPNMPPAMVQNMPPPNMLPPNMLPPNRSPQNMPPPNMPRPNRSPPNMPPAMVQNIPPAMAQNMPPPNMPPPMVQNMPPPSVPPSMAQNMPPPNMPPNIPPNVPPNVFPNVPPNMPPNVPPNMLPPNRLPPNVPPAMFPGNKPYNPALFLPRIGPVPPLHLSPLDYKISKETFATLAAKIKKMEEEKQKNEQNARRRAQTNGVTRETRKGPNATRNKRSNKSKKTTAVSQSAPNATGTVDQNAPQGTTATNNENVTQVAQETMEQNTTQGTQITEVTEGSPAVVQPNIKANMEPKAMEAIRAYLGPDSASNVAKYMVKNMVPCPYETVDSMEPTNVNGPQPCNQDVGQQPSNTNVSTNVNVATEDDDVQIIEPGQQVGNQQPQVVNEEPQVVNEEVQAVEEEVQVVEEEPIQRRTRTRGNRRNAIRELCNQVRRGRGTRGTNRRTNRNGNRNTRRNANRSQASSTRPCTEYVENEPPEVNEEAPTTAQGPRRELELLANPQSETVLNEMVPSKRKIVDVDGQGQVRQDTEEFEWTAIKRHCGDETTRSTISTLRENFRIYNFVSVHDSFNQIEEMEKQMKLEEMRRAQNTEICNQSQEVNEANMGRQVDIQQLVGSYPFQEYRTSNEIYPSFYYRPNPNDQVIHNYLYGNYLMEAGPGGKVPYGYYPPPPGYYPPPPGYHPPPPGYHQPPPGYYPPPPGYHPPPPGYHPPPPGYHPPPPGYYPENYMGAWNPGNAENLALAGNQWSENRVTGENKTDAENANGDNRLSIENTTNTSRNTSIENVTNTSGNTSIENVTNTSGNTSIESGTEVDNAANWSYANEGYYAQDYYYGGAVNGGGYYQEYPSMGAEDRFSQQKVALEDMEFETACEYVATHCNFDQPKTSTGQTGPENNNREQGTWRDEAQNPDARQTSANKSKDNQNDHQVNGGEAPSMTQESDWEEVKRQLYAAYDED